MTRIRKFNTDLVEETAVSRPSADLLVSGDPQFCGWPFLNEGGISSGIWSATPGAHKMSRGEFTKEYFYILEGEVEITESGENPKIYKAGDLVVVEPNFRGIWRTLKPIKKHYFSIDLQSRTLS